MLSPCVYHQVQVQGPADPNPSTISVSNLKYMYWNFKQQLVHHRYISMYLYDDRCVQIILTPARYTCAILYVA